jgi:hypothetical protein
VGEERTFASQWVKQLKTLHCMELIFPNAKKIKNPNANP